MDMNKMDMNKKDGMEKGGMKMGGMMGKMNMHGSPAPKELKAAKDPKFPVGTEVVVLADHMPGMKGARGVVVGAYDAKLYTVDYTDTETHEVIKNHKYLVGAEIVGDLRIGSDITLEADHMSGMKGSHGTIVNITEGPAYMIDYTSNDDMHMKITNHKWIATSELEKA